MATVKHTPTPYEAVGLENPDNQIVYIKSDTSPDGDICDFYHVIDHGENKGHIFLKDKARANAEFIVRACNSHEDLITTIKRFLSIRNGHGKGFNKSYIRNGKSNRQSGG